MRKLKWLMSTLLVMGFAICFTYGVDVVRYSYWNVLYFSPSAQAAMTQEEKIANANMVIPVNERIEFSSRTELDGTQYGYVYCAVNTNVGYSYGGAKASSDKNITDGLYKNKFPMIKQNSGRQDIKWFYYPSVDYEELVFIKFSIGTFTSEWVSLESKIEVSLDTSSMASFKLEGIRVIYDCDYAVVTRKPYEAYRFVNDDKANASTLVAAGAKYMDLPDAVFNTLTYSYFPAGGSGTSDSIEFSSQDKINFKDEATAEWRQEDNERTLYEKIRQAERTLTKYAYTGEGDRSYYESLLKEIEDADISEESRDNFKSQIERILEKYDMVYEERHPTTKSKIKKFFK